MGQMDRTETRPPGGGAGTPTMRCPIFLPQGTTAAKTKFRTPRDVPKRSARQWKLARNYSEQHGEPIGYDRLTGTALLDIEQSAFFDVLPKDKPMSYKEIQHSLGQSEGQITRFLAACDNAGVVISTGKRKTRSRRYTFLAEKNPPKTAEELELEKSVQEAFA